jgi:hypothetical protein
MGFMDFLKKKSDSGLGSDAASFDIGNTDFDKNTGSASPALNYGQDLNPSTDFSGMNNSSFGQSPMQQSTSQGPDISKDLQMISLKLDSIKSELDAINQRLKSLESIAEREQIKTTKKWY